LKQSELGTNGVVLLSMQVWLTAEGGNSLANNKGAMMQSSVKIENSDSSGLQVWRGLAWCRLVVRLRHIIVPVDLMYGCPTSIDYAICFAGALMK
jgi:hypothetical protein